MHRVIFALSEAAQRAAVLAGEDARAVQEFQLGSYDNVVTATEHAVALGCKLNDTGKARLERALKLGAAIDRHGEVMLLFGVARTDPRAPYTYSALGTESLDKRPKTVDEALDAIERARSQVAHGR